MKKIVLSLLCLCLLSTGTSAVRTTAQTSPPQNRTQQETLTNANVIELVRMGLSEATIIEVIRRSNRNFDTSVAGLRQLRAGRVADAIIREMLNPQAAETTAPAPTPGESATPTTVATPTSAADPLLATPREPGIYMRDGDQLIEIFPTRFTGARSNALGRIMTYGIMRSRVRASARGQMANTTTAQRRPEFYFFFNGTGDANRMSAFHGFSASSPGEFVMIKMARRNNSREAVLSEASDYSSSSGARDRDMRDFSFERVRPGIFRVTPRADLDAGDYCFFFASSVGEAGMAGGRLFDFSITTP